jgi:hypothetical protein
MWNPPLGCATCIAWRRRGSRSGWSARGSLSSWQSTLSARSVSLSEPRLSPSCSVRPKLPHTNPGSDWQPLEQPLQELDPLHLVFNMCADLQAIHEFSFLGWKVFLQNMALCPSRVAFLISCCLLQVCCSSSSHPPECIPETMLFSLN